MEYSPGLANMYGSLTTIVLVMLWLYFCMYIILIGAEINSYFEDQFRRVSYYRRMLREQKKEQAEVEKELREEAKEKAEKEI